MKSRGLNLHLLQWNRPNKYSNIAYLSAKNAISYSHIQMYASNCIPVLTIKSMPQHTYMLRKMHINLPSGVILTMN